jgi:hypothetical protein
MVAHSPLFRIGQPYDQNARMGARPKPPRIGEVEVLSNEEATLCLGGSPNLGVVPSSQLFRKHRIDVEPKDRQPGRHRRSDEVVPKHDESMFLQIDASANYG